MDKIDDWIEKRFGTKNTFNRQLLDNFIEFLEKELGYKSPEEIKKQSDERVKKVFRQTVKALERRYRGYVKWDREKVAIKIASEAREKKWADLLPEFQDYYRQRADQLHKILKEEV